MRTLSLLILLSVPSAVAAPAMASAEPAALTPREECLAARLTRIAAVAAQVEQKAREMELTLPESSVKAKATLATLKKDAADIQAQIAAALADPKPETLEEALTDSAIAVSWLYSGVATLVYDLMAEQNPEAATTAGTIVDILNAGLSDIPLDDPTRGCE